MKRLFTLLLIFIICVTFFVLPVSANNYDSRYLTEEEKAKLSVSYDDDIVLTPENTVIKLYNGTYFYDFIKGKDIETAISTKRVVYMFVTSSKDVYAKHIYQDRVGTLMYHKEWEGFYTYTVSPDLVFGPSVKVNKIYCLNSFNELMGAYIYYETDHGKYVLFTECKNSPYIYLLTFEDFNKYLVAVYYEDRGEPDQFGISFMLDELCDAEKARFNNTPHAVSHPDADNDEKCDACGGAIPEDNDPFYHISDITIDESTNVSDNTDETEVTDNPADNTDETEVTDNPIDNTDETEVTDNPTDNTDETEASDKPTGESEVIDTSDKHVEDSVATNASTDKIEIGCESSVTLSAVVFVGLIGVTLFLKKKED